MKKQSLILILLFAVGTTFAQTKVPTAVKEAFAKAYPKATEVKWDKENKNEYEANCKNENVVMSLVYNAKGELLETETEIPVTDFPTKVIEHIHKLYPTAIITGGDKIVTNIGVVSYEADLTIGKKKIEKQFAADGSFVK